MLAILVAAGTALAGLSLARVNSAQHRQVDRLDPASKVADDLFISLLNQETGLRGYALSRQDAYLQPYTQGRTETDVDLRRLHGPLLPRAGDLGAAGQAGIGSAHVAAGLAPSRRWQHPS